MRGHGQLNGNESGATLIHSQYITRNIIRNAKGEYGRTRPIPHIAPVEEWAISETPTEIKRKLE